MQLTPDQFTQALSDSTRLRVLALLQDGHELCVCELTHAIGAAQPHISRHLAQLRELGLIRDRRQGLWIHYRVNRDLPVWVVRVLEELVQGVRDQAPYVADERALCGMANRPGAPRCA